MIKKTRDATRGAWRGALAVVALAIVLFDLAGCGSSYTSSGIIYYRQKNYEKAVEQLTLAVEANPKDYKAQYHLAVSLAELGRWPEAATHFTAAREADPAKVNEVDLQQGHYWSVNHNAGVADMGKKEYTTAIEHFKAATEVWPEKAESYSLLGSTYAAVAKGETEDAKKVADLEKAAEYLGMAAAKDPKDAATWLDLGATQLRLKKNADAEKSFQTALDVTPPDSVDTRVDIYLRMGDMSFLAARELPAADSLQKRELYGQAYERYSKAAELRPNDPRTTYQLALSQYNRLNYSEAAELFGKVADLSEGTDADLFRDASYNRGLACLNSQQPECAVDAANKLLAVKEDAKYYILRAQGNRVIADQLDKAGKAQEAKKMKDEVVEDYKKAEALNPGG